MLERNRRLLSALRTELKFFQSGGYGQPFRSQWRSTILIRDSPICSDFTAAGALNPCQECPLLSLVPFDKRNHGIPCHHIALDAERNTIARLYQTGSQQALDRRYSDWLVSVITGLEQQRQAA